MEAAASADSFAPPPPPPRQYYVSSSHPHYASLLQLILLDHGFERAARLEDDWHLMWFAGQIDPTLLRHLKPHQKVNKFPNAGCLTTKSQLWTTFERMRRKHGVEHFGFIPQSYVLPEEAEGMRAAMMAAVAAAPATNAPATNALATAAPAANDSEAADDQASAATAATEAIGSADAAVWIVKPVAACRGQGITLHRSSDGLPSEVATRRGIGCAYVHPPYLMHGRKCDLRLYVLVTSWRPLVVYLHAEGLARLATEAYALTDLDSTSKHLTNYAINKLHTTTTAAAATAGVAGNGGGDDGSGGDNGTSPGTAVESPPPSGPKVGLDEFRRYLIGDLGQAKAEQVWRAIDEAIVKTAIAAEPTMGQAVATYVPHHPSGVHGTTQHCFQLLGFDVMLDAFGRPWVVEVNLDPSLATDADLDLRVKGTMLTDLLNLVDAGGTPDKSEDPRRVATGSDGDGDDVQFEKCAAGGPPKTEATLTASEVRVLRNVDAEFRRSQAGRWRRLHPSARSANGDYARFFDPSRRSLQTLPFAVC